ncbi:MAG: peptidylprolyl isomerase [Alphaproteobacteria bacterium]|nr:peptidylprolyl isomerase [Alphaproteobacteria bacterium]
MLEYLRNASEKTIAKVLISILAFSFVGWGVADWIFGGSAGDNTLLTVGGTKVSAQQFNVEKSRELAKMTKEEQRKVYADIESQNKFAQQVLADMITEQMVENRANDLGFVVSDHRIAREIREFPEFQENGEFSTLAFDTVLNNSGYSEAQFADILRGQVARSMVLGAMAVPVPVPEFAKVAAYNARYAERDIDFATVKYSDFDVATPTEEQLQAFYAQNQKILPETRAVSYVLVPAEMAQPDKYDAGYAIAVKVEDDIIAGEKMADAAKKHGAKYVQLDAFARDNRPADKMITDAMLARIFDMDQGLESEMIETKDGFMFLMVDKINPEHAADFKDVRAFLGDEWKKDEQKKLAYVRANELLVDLNGGADLQNKKSVRVSRTSGAPVDVLVAAFSNPVGTNTIVPGTDAFYVLSVGGITEPKSDSAKMKHLSKELENMVQKNVMDDYNSFLQREYPVEVNEKVFDKFFQAK